MRKVITDSKLINDKITEYFNNNLLMKAFDAFKC